MLFQAGPCTHVERHADIAPNLVKPYKINDQTVNQELELKHGESTRRFAMDKVSNAPFEQVRFARLLFLWALLDCFLAERVRASGQGVRG